MPWLSVKFSQRDLAKQLNDLFEVSEVPCLVVLGPDGKVLTNRGREAVSADPKGNR
jgi:nucleoredoxin